MTATPAETSNLMLRNDTVLGVCQAIGEDFGFNPNWLRVAFCAPIFWNPALVIGVYLALGVVVGATRLAFPDRKMSVHSETPAGTAAAAVQPAQATSEPELIAA